VSPESVIFRSHCSQQDPQFRPCATGAGLGGSTHPPCRRARWVSGWASGVLTGWCCGTGTPGADRMVTWCDCPIRDSGVWMVLSGSWIRGVVLSCAGWWPVRSVRPPSTAGTTFCVAASASALTASRTGGNAKAASLTLNAPALTGERLAPRLSHTADGDRCHPFAGAVPCLRPRSAPLTFSSVAAHRAPHLWLPSLRPGWGVSRCASCATKDSVPLGQLRDIRDGRPD
jgi:hypothetical protein